MYDTNSYYYSNMNPRYIIIKRTLLPHIFMMMMAQKNMNVPVIFIANLCVLVRKFHQICFYIHICNEVEKPKQMGMGNYKPDCE